MFKLIVVCVGQLIEHEIKVQTPVIDKNLSLFLFSDGSPKLVSFTSQEMVNSGLTTILVCSVTGHPVPGSAMVTVANSEGILVPLRDTQKFNRLYKRENQYGVVVNTSGEVYSCNLTLSNGSVMQKSFTVNVFSK